MALHNLYRTPQWLRPGSGISFVFRGSDEAMEITTSAGGAVTRPQDFAATAGTGADDTAALNSWIAETGLKYLPNGDYLASGSVSAFPHTTLILADDASESGTKLPFISITEPGVNFKNTPKNHVFVRQNTTYRDDEYTIQVHRIVNTDDGYTSPKALRVWTQNNLASNTQAEWAISGELDSYTTVSGVGGIAVSGVTNKYASGTVFAGHFQINDMFKYDAATDVTGTVSTEMNMQVIGADHPTANNSLGNRFVLDLLPRTATGVSGWDTATGNYGQAEVGSILRVRTDNQTAAYARNGITITDTGNTGTIATALRIATRGGRSIYCTGNVTGTQFQIDGNGTNGIILNGTYSGVAYRMNEQQYFAVEATSAIKMSYAVTANIWGFYSTSTERIGFDMNAGALRVNGTKVVGPRDTGWTAMTGTPDESTAYATGTVTLAQLAGRVMALQTALTTHGLIGA